MKIKFNKKIFTIASLSIIGGASVLTPVSYLASTFIVDKNNPTNLEKNNVKPNLILDDFINLDNEASKSKIKNFFYDMYDYINFDNTKKIDLFIQSYSSENWSLSQILDTVKEEIIDNFLVSDDFKRLQYLNDQSMIVQKIESYILNLIQYVGQYFADAIGFNYEFVNTIFDSNISYDSYENMNKKYLDLFDADRILNENKNNITELYKTNPTFKEMMQNSKTDPNNKGLDEKRTHTLAQISSIVDFQDYEENYITYQYSVFEHYFPEIGYVRYSSDSDIKYYLSSLNTYTNSGNNNQNKFYEFLSKLYKNLLKPYFNDNYEYILEQLRTNNDSIFGLYNVTLDLIKYILKLNFISNEKLSNIIDYIFVILENETDISKDKLESLRKIIDLFYKKNYAKLISDLITFAQNYDYNSQKSDDKFHDFMKSLPTEFEKILKDIFKIPSNKNINYKTLNFIIDVIVNIFSNKSKLKSHITEIMNLYRKDEWNRIIGNMEDTINQIKIIGSTIDGGIKSFDDFQSILVSIKKIFNNIFGVRRLPNPTSLINVFYELRFDEFGSILKKIKVILQDISSNYHFENKEFDKLFTLMDRISKLMITFHSLIDVAYAALANPISTTGVFPFLGWVGKGFRTIVNVIAGLLNGQKDIGNRLVLGSIVANRITYELSFVCVFRKMFEGTFNLFDYLHENNISLSTWIQSHFAYCGEDVWGTIGDCSIFDEIAEAFIWLGIKIDILNWWHSCISVLEKTTEKDWVSNDDW